MDAALSKEPYEGLGWVDFENWMQLWYLAVDWFKGGREEAGMATFEVSKEA